MQKEWYSPSEVIRFKQVHLDFIFEYYEVLNEGRWPHKASGYLDAPFSGKQFRGAYFETPMCIIAEFHWRLSKTGWDGDLLKQVKCYHSEEKLVCRIARINIEELEYRIGKAMNYIKGRRKKRSYEEFKLRRKIKE